MDNDILGISAHVDISELTNAYSALIDLLDKLEAISEATGQRLKSTFKVLDESLSNGNTEAVVASLAAALDVVRSKVVETLQAVADGKSELGFEEIAALVSTYRDVAMSTLSTTQSAYQKEAASVQQLEVELSRLLEQSHEMANVGDVQGFEKIGRQMDATATALAESRERMVKLSEAIDEAQKHAESAQGAFESMSDATKEIAKSEAKEAIKEFGEGLGEMAEKAANWLTGSDKLTGSMAAMKQAISMLPAPIANTINGIKGMTVAAWKLVATPLGAVLGAIALALKAVFTWFNKSAEGQRAFAKVSAYVGSLLDSLTDIIVKVGGYLFKAFTDGNGALNAFANSLVNTLSNAVRSAYHTINGLVGAFKALKNYLTDINYSSSQAESDLASAWSELTKGGNFFVDAMSDMADTIKNVWKGMGRVAADAWNNFSMEGFKAWSNDTISRANTALHLAGQQLDNEKSLLDVKQQQAEIASEIQESEERITRLSGAEKSKEIAKLRELNEQYYDKEITVRKKALDILKQQNSLHSSTIEDLQAEQTLRTEILRIESMKASAMRRNSQMSAKHSERAAKAAERQAKADARTAEAIRQANDKVRELEAHHAIKESERVMELEERVTQARIDAMEEGSAKILAQRKHDHEKELQAIANEADKMVQAERDEQKRIFDENQKSIKASGGTARDWNEKLDLDRAPIQRILEYYKELVELEEERYQREQNQRSIDSMDEYIRKYGDFASKQALILQDFQKEVEAAAGDPWKVLSAENKRDEALSELKTQFGLKTQEFADIFGDAAKLSVKAIQEIINKYEQLVKYLKDNSGNASADILSTLGLSTKEIQQVITGKVSINELEAQIKQLKGTLKDKSPYQSFVNNLNAALKKLSESSGNAMKVGSAITDIGKACYEFLPSVESFTSSIANIFGIDDGMVSNTTGFFKGLTTAAQGIGQLIEGNYFDGMEQAVYGLSSVVSGLRDMLEGGINMDYVYDNAELKAIRESVDAILERMDSSSTAESIKLYQEALERYDESEKAAQKTLINAMKKSSSNLSMSINHKSANRYMWDFGGYDELNQVNRLLGTNVESWEDLWLLSPDQLKKIQRELPHVFSIILKGISSVKEHASKTEDDRHAKEALDEYLKLTGTLDEIEEKFSKKITGTTLESVQNEFANTLSDMNADAQTFAEKFENMLKNAVINSLMADVFNEKIEGWYTSFINAYRNDNKLDEDEVSKLRSDWKEITEEGIKMRDDLLKTIGYDYGIGVESGAFKAASTFTQDQGDELNGRLAAIQIGQQQGIVQRTEIIDLQKEQLGQFVQLNGHFINIASDISNMREMQFDSLRRLTEIRDYTSVLPTMANSIENIERYTSRI